MSQPPPPPDAASSAAGAPSVGAEIEFEYVWHEGSVPPPDHYWFSIKGSTGGHGQIVFVAGYAFEVPPQWVESFTITPERAEALRVLLGTKKLMDRPWRESLSLAVGGSYRTFSLREGARLVELPAQLCADDAALADELAGQIQALVPESIWRDLRERHAAHIRSCCR